MAETPNEFPLLINAQYIKDLSFENPNAPEIYSLLGANPPEMTVNIDIIPTPLAENTYEVLLTFRVQAVSAKKAAFLVDLDYAGIVTVAKSVPEDEIEPLLMIETPRHLFPFARNILAEVTRDGSFPPLVINPIDFDQYYQRHKKGSMKANNAGGATAPKTAPASSEA